jgi:UDP-3-O-[3-hydroxymyristoyl] glucosamine N-acyltransferase
MNYTVNEIATLLGLAFQGDGDCIIRRVSSWENADESALIFVEPGRTAADVSGEPRAGCIIARPDSASPRDVRATIFSSTPKLDFARAAALILPRPRSSGQRHCTAVIAADAVIGDGCELGAHVVVGARAQIGRGCILQSGVVIGDDCVLGDDCILYPRVVLYPGASIGKRVMLHAGVVVGSDGFGYVFDGRTHVKFPQADTIVIEDDVEIGANTTIDRGSLGPTRIGAGTRIDNLVQIAHNVQIGKGVIIAAQCGISGSTVIEDYVILGGQIGIGDHVHIQSGAVVGSKAGILPHKIVRGGEVYWGVPIRPLREFKRINAIFGRLPELKAELDALKAAVARLADSGKSGEE